MKSPSLPYMIGLFAAIGVIAVRRYLRSSREYKRRELERLERFADVIEGRKRA